MDKKAIYKGRTYKMNIEREPYLYKSKKEKSEKYTRPDLIEIKIGEVTKLF